MEKHGIWMEHEYESFGTLSVFGMEKQFINFLPTKDCFGTLSVFGMEKLLTNSLTVAFGFWYSLSFWYGETAIAVCRL